MKLIRWFFVVRLLIFSTSTASRGQSIRLLEQRSMATADRKEGSVAVGLPQVWSNLLITSQRSVVHDSSLLITSQRSVAHLSWRRSSTNGSAGATMPREPASREPAPNFAWVSMAFPLNRIHNLRDLYRIYTLANSIRKHSEYPLVVLTDLTTLEPTTSFHEDMQRLRVQFRHMAHLNMSTKLKSQLGRMSSWGAAYQKLQVFNLIDYDKLVWLDSDAIVTKQMDHLFQLQGHWSKFDWCIEGDRANQHNLSVNSGLLIVEPNAEHFEGLLAKGETLAANGTLYMGDQQVIETYFKDIGQPVQILGEEEARFGRCWNATSKKPIPGYVHKPPGFDSCLTALSQITKDGRTNKMSACTSNVLGCMYRDGICDANISNDTVAKTFCSSKHSNCLTHINNSHSTKDTS